ncbi:MAG: EF-hand domain-containing protein, partial [Gimesia chilikensis]
MKMNRIVTACALGMAVFSWSSATQAEEGKKGQRPNREEILKKFDKDGDGKLNEEERSAARAARGEKGGQGFNREEFMKKFDKNGDGKLDENER